MSINKANVNFVGRTDLLRAKLTRHSASTPSRPSRDIKIDEIRSVVSNLSEAISNGAIELSECTELSKNRQPERLDYLVE